MASVRLVNMPIDAKPDAPVGYLFGLPLDRSEALAYMDHEANVATPGQRDILRGWVVKMTLVHGTWVADRFRLLQD